MAKRSTSDRDADQLCIPLASAPGSKVYRDVIHGDVMLDELGVELVDTPEFQRLGGIRQLGFAHLVYRSAQHTRLQHSIGVYRVAMDLLERISENHSRYELPPITADLPECFSRPGMSRLQGLRRFIGACALLHDIGHVPYGHTLEDEFEGQYEKHDGLRSLRLYRFLYHPESKVHKTIVGASQPWVGTISNADLLDLIYLTLSYRERVGPDTEGVEGDRFTDILEREITEVRERLNETRDSSERGPLQEVEGALKRLRAAYDDFRLPLDSKTPRDARKPRFFAFMSDIIANTICADLIDYLKRDAFHTGFPSAVNDRLFRYFVVADDPNAGGRHLVLSVYQSKRRSIKRDVVTMIFDLLRDRYKLSQQVYYHRVKAAASTMLVRGMLDVGIPEGHFYQSTGESITRLTDEGLVDCLTRSESAVSAEMGRLLRDRRLYKTILTVPWSAAIRSPGGVGRFVERLRDDTSSRSELERRLAGLAGAAAHHVLVYCPGPKMQAKHVQVRVRLGEHRIAPLTRFPDDPLIDRELALLEDSYRAQWQVYVFMHPQLSSDYARALIIDAFIDEFELRGNEHVEFYQGHRRPTDHRLDAFTGWSLKQPGMVVGDAEEMRQAIQDPEDWAELVREAAEHDVQPLDLDGLFEILRTRVYVRAFVVEQMRIGPDHTDHEAVFRDVIGRVSTLPVEPYRGTRGLERNHYFRRYSDITGFTGWRD